MSGNGPIGHAGLRLPLRRQPADDPRTAPPTAQPQPSWPPQFTEAMARQAPQPDPGAARGHYHAGQPAAPAQPQYVEPQRTYANAPQYSEAQPAQQAAPGYYFPQGEPDPNYGYQPQAPAQPLPFNRYAQPPAQEYGQPLHTQPTQPAGQWSAQPDPRAYDLGNYMPNQPQPAEPAALQPLPEPSHLHAGPYEHRLGGAQQGFSEPEDFDDNVGDEEEEPRRFHRGMLIAAALVGAIGIGGALAYTYKTFVATSSTRAPLIKAADFGPNKVRPDASDGKTFAHTDKKLLNRLGEDTGQPRSAAQAPAAAADASDERAGDDPSAPRKVRVIPINPAGQAPAAVTAQVPPPRTTGPMVLVPGLAVDNLGPPPAAPAQPPSAARIQLPPQQPPAQAPAKAAQPQQPPLKVVSAGTAAPQAPAVPAAPAAKAAPAVAEPAAPPKKTAAIPANPPVKKPVPRAKDADAAARPPSATGTSGYVAVLSSQKTRMDALKAFADMQQKYGDVLGSKTPDVQEADLSARGLGTMYRLVVGPPGSRDAASGICSKLKTAGYNGCWVTAY